MHVLLTRPLADSLATAANLNEKNIATTIEPLFEIIPRDVDLPETENVSGLIFTSRHAVTIFSDMTGLRDVTAFCVGDNTAEQARENGFTNVLSANGDEDDLVALIIERDDKAGRILRLTGYDHDDAVADALNVVGYDVQTVQIYTVMETLELSFETIEQIKAGTIDGVLFFSPKTVCRFYTMIHKHDLSAPCRAMTAWCISKNAADAMDDLEFKQVVIAPKPTQKELLGLILS